MARVVALRPPCVWGVVVLAPVKYYGGQLYTVFYSLFLTLYFLVLLFSARMLVLVSLSYICSKNLLRSSGRDASVRLTCSLSILPTVLR